MDPKEIERRITTAFPDAEVTVQADGNHFGLRIVSEAFDGLSRVRRQQAVYSALGDAITGGAMHAVTMRTLTPAESSASGAGG